MIAASLLTERTTTSDTYIKMKEFTIKKMGTYRVSFDLRIGATNCTAYGCIYKNGAAFGTERSSTIIEYTNFQEDLDFTKEDLCQLYGHRGATTVTLYIKDFILKASVYASEVLD